MKNATLFISFILLLNSCAPKDAKPVMVQSNGQMNQVLVVMNHDLWNGLEGDELRKITNEEILGLPQPESQFRTTQIPTSAYKNMFLSQKNILFANIADTAIFNVRKDVYARPQIIITITAKDSESLIAELQSRKNQIIQTFKNSDLKAVQNRLRKKQFNKSNLITLDSLGIDLQIPITYKLVDDTGDFLWLRQHLKQGQSSNILIYELPINTIEDEEGQNINSVRDTIGKKYIPGQFEGSYYITEQAYTPHTFLVELEDKKTFETRGKWEVKNDFMAGPFLNYTIVDKANNRLIVLEGFTYAPATNKRDYMFEIEAILKTVKFKE